MLVAVKVWMHSRDEDQEGVDYDLMNFYSQMRLRFDNIASIVGMCTDVEPYYIIYEYLERVSTQYILEQIQGCLGCLLPWPRLRYFIAYWT